MAYANVSVTGIWHGYAGKHAPGQGLKLQTVRETQESFFFGVIEHTTGDYGYQVLVDGKISTLNQVSGTGANSDDVNRASEQAFAFWLPMAARRKAGKHEILIKIGHFKDEEFIPTSDYKFEIEILTPETE